jgi:hypothetical protein
MKPIALMGWVCLAACSTGAGPAGDNGMTGPAGPPGEKGMTGSLGTPTF